MHFLEIEMNWKLANEAPKNETPVIFADRQNIYLGKRHQNLWLDKDDGIISEGVNYWTDEIPVPPTFLNGKPMNDDSKGWEISSAPDEGVYVLVAMENGKLTIARFSQGWIDRKGNKIENVLCSYPLPELKQKK